jgi:hypothetical protein
MKEYTQEFLNDKCDKMFEYLKAQVPSMDKEELVIERLMHLGRMLSESGEYKAVAQYKVDSVIHGEIGRAIAGIATEKISASTLNAYIKAAAKDWNYFVNAFDRINSAAGKQIMALQTVISYEKQKMSIL